MRKILNGFFILLSQMVYSQTYPIVDTKITKFYSDSEIISEVLPGSAYYGQDANYLGNQPSYTNLENGIIQDNVTGLMWEQEMGDKITWFEAFVKADTLTLGGYNDWRVPSLKELYSLIIFTGQVQGESPIEPFIDTSYFVQPYGNLDLGERLIDAQTWSSTQYKGLTMNGDTTVFGVNFVDGRIKGYPKYDPANKNVARTMYFRLVRGNHDYGKNDFYDHGNGTISDLATGLMWQQADNGNFYNWEEALEYAEDLELNEYKDWRLPNAKELQSVVDYERGPQNTSSPAIDPLFSCTEIQDPDGNWGQYPYYWTSTTHLDGINPYSGAAYVAFGEAQGKMNLTLMDVHGAGAQRSDPKSGNTNDFPDFHGPQGDVRYVYNAVRCVRDLSSNSIETEKNKQNISIFPNPAKAELFIQNSTNELISSVRIINSQGQLIATYNDIDDSTGNLDISYFERGYYVLAVLTSKGLFIKKLLII